MPTIDLFRVRHRHFSQLQDNQILFQKLLKQLEIFLRTILRDEHISSFELVYQFLNPSIIDNDKQLSNLIMIKKKQMNLNKNLLYVKCF